MDSESFSMLKDVFGALKNSDSFGAAVMQILNKYNCEMSDEQKTQMILAVMRAERASRIKEEVIVWEDDYF